LSVKASGGDGSFENDERAKMVAAQATAGPQRRRRGHPDAPASGRLTAARS
jgi:hypothetical protein